MKTPPIPPLLLAGAALLAGGCASPSPSPIVPHGGSAAGSSSEFPRSGYAWNDPFFYDPWYDPAAIVLPPPLPGLAASGVRAGPAGTDSAGVKEVDYR